MLPMAFVMVYLLPALSQCMLGGVWHRFSGAASGIVALALCMFTIQKDLTWMWDGE